MGIHKFIVVSSSWWRHKSSWRSWVNVSQSLHWLNFCFNFSFIRFFTWILNVLFRAVLLFLLLFLLILLFFSFWFSGGASWFWVTSSWWSWHWNGIFFGFYFLLRKQLFLKFNRIDILQMNDIFKGIESLY